VSAVCALHALQPDLESTVRERSNGPNGRPARVPLARSGIGGDQDACLPLHRDDRGGEPTSIGEV
jgi:hypothetical protein